MNSRSGTLVISTAKQMFRPIEPELPGKYKDDESFSMMSMDSAERNEIQMMVQQFAEQTKADYRQLQSAVQHELKKERTLWHTQLDAVRSGHAQTTTTLQDAAKNWEEVSGRVVHLHEAHTKQKFDLQQLQHDYRGQIQQLQFDLTAVSNTCELTEQRGNEFMKRLAICEKAGNENKSALQQFKNGLAAYYHSAGQFLCNKFKQQIQEIQSN